CVRALQVPIKESLLRYSDSELNELATKSFMTLMRFMGDQPKLRNQDDAQCVYEILQVCDFYLGKLRNCLIPQFFLSHRESVLRGWLLLNLLTGFFLPSNILMPYATKFLQQASSDPSSTHHGTAVSVSCETNGCPGFTKAQLSRKEGRIQMAVLLPSTCSGAELSFPGCSIYLLLSSLQVARELLQEICEQMGAGEQEEMQEFALFAIRNKVVRPIRMEEYLHDYLLEDMLVTVSLRRLTWKIPLHFEDKIYTDIHYGQVSNEDVSTFWHREELKEYIPKSLQSQISTETLQNHLDRLLRTMQPLRPVDAKIQFIGEEIALWLCSLTQELCHIIPLKELQRMRTLRPTSEQGLPGIELNYGSAANPKTLWIELSQAKEMYHTTVFILDKTDFQH
uniref:MyTH4 domain-containing protein n=1 Tax=Phasianus colchicus TaxID=9054 RepID=A0A669QD59_PHACC